jgi:hypothetical protein
MGSAAMPDTTFGSAGEAPAGVCERGNRSTSRRGLLTSEALLGGSALATGVTTSHGRRIVIALGCAALIIVLELGGPAAGHAQPNSGDRGLHELWNMYPLEPKTGEAGLRTENQFDRPQAQLPRSGGTAAGRSTGFVGGRASGVKDGSSVPTALLVLVLSIVGSIVIVLVARPVVTVGRQVPRSRHLGFRARAAVGAGLGRADGRAAHLPLRVRAAVGAAVRSAMVGMYSNRGEILLYALAVGASAAVGVGVTLLLGDG